MSCPDSHRFDRKMHNSGLPGVHPLLRSEIAATGCTPPPATLSTGKTAERKTDGWTESTRDLDLHERHLFNQLINRLPPPRSFAAADLWSERHTKREALHRSRTGIGTRLWLASSLCCSRSAFWNVPSVSTEPPGNSGLLLESKRCDRIKPISTKIWKRRYFPLNGIIWASMADESQTEPVDILSHASWNTRQ